METQSTFSFPKWTVSTTLGFIAGVVLILILATLLKMKSEPIILLIIVVGGMLSGYIQYHYFLKKIFINSKRWILFSFSGWLAAIVITSVAFLPTILHLELNNFFKMINKIAFILCGPVLGFITGKGMTSIIKNDTSLENQL